MSVFLDNLISRCERCYRLQNRLTDTLLILQFVMSCIEGSPAARAGIHQGDELLEINGIYARIS